MSPSQVEKVAQQAGKAAPAVAIAGALVAVPSTQALAATAAPAVATAAGHQASAAASTGTAATAHPGRATLDAVAARAVTVASTSTARHAAKATYYEVRSGDSLSSIAERFYHNSGDWQYLYDQNDKTISNPNMIYVGERLFIPAAAPAHYVAKHAKPAPHPVTTSRIKSSKPASHGSTKIVTTALTSYSCSALENLWDQAGGSPSHAVMAAEIARAESSGNPNAISPTDDFGLWQINASNGRLATLNPYENARSAITLSDNGASWNAWTTYHSGAYYGQC